MIGALAFCRLVRAIKFLAGIIKRAILQRPTSLT